MMAMDASMKRGCLIGGFSCGGIAVLGVCVAVFLISANWDDISGFVKDASGEVKSLLAVQAALSEAVDCDSVEVKVNFQSSDGERKRQLAIEIINPGEIPSLLHAEGIDEEQALEAWAREIAKRALAAYEGDIAFSQVSIGFHSKTGSIVAISTSRRFEFSPEELLGSLGLPADSESVEQ